MRPLVRKFIPVSFSKGSHGRKNGKIWTGSSNTYSDSKQHAWISFERKNTRQQEINTIDQAENGTFLPIGGSGFGNNLTAWHDDASRASDGDNIPLKPRAVHAQNEVRVDQPNA